MRILIADDEYLVRQTLISMLVELGIGRELIDEVTHGKALLEQMEVAHYDMAFVDIHMPNMNGIRAIGQAKEHYTYTKWVIVTGYSEFEYAKQAIELGVSSYLLKPISMEELGKVTSSLLRENKQCALSLNQQFEADINDYYRSTRYLSEEQFPWLASIALKSFSIDIHSLDDELRCNVMQQVLSAIREKIKTVVQLNCRLVCLGTTDMAITVIGAWGFFGEYEAGEQAMEEFHNKLKVIIKRFSCRGLNLSLVVTGTSQTMDEVLRGLQQVYNMSTLKVLQLGKAIYDLQQLKGIMDKATDNELKFANAYRGLLDAYYSKNYLAYMGYVDTLEQLVKQPKLYRLLESNLQVIFQSTPVEGVSSTERLRQLANNRLVGGKTKTQVYLDPIDQVKLYIEENFMLNIGINQIAEQLHLTPNYLSALFKKKEGITFMKYLTKTRMLMAKDLLSRSPIKVSQVATQVGFSSTRHFSKLFKNYYNIYPSELKQQRK